MTLDAPEALRAAVERAAWGTGVQGIEERGGARGRVSVRLWLPAERASERTVETLRAAVPEARVRTRRVALRGVGELRSVRLGARFLVDARASGEFERDGRFVLALSAAEAFGDGLHATTQLCVERLEALLEERVVRSALDVGTGTGVLALVMARLGVRRVVATDVDPLALRAARRTVRAHGADVRVQRALPRGLFELVVANVYGDVLRAMLPALAARTERVLVLSGFSPRAAGVLAAALDALGLRVRASRRRGGWAALVAERGRA